MCPFTIKLIDTPEFYTQMLLFSELGNWVRRLIRTTVPNKMKQFVHSDFATGQIRILLFNHGSVLLTILVNNGFSFILPIAMSTQINK